MNDHLGTVITAITTNSSPEIIRLFIIIGILSWMIKTIFESFTKSLNQRMTSIESQIVSNNDIINRRFDLLQESINDLNRYGYDVKNKCINGESK